MQRSSESIAQLACALAKAQIELVNPEKTLEATIYPDGAGQGRSFSYASLASGLDIVRKTLGQHEIATVQTTAIDAPTQTVTLTTVLAHSSGEWIASNWPVCRVAETATPHRMGAALTYARRYALFTLVGIAGEDDLDAPDLQSTPANQTTPTSQPSERGRPRGIGNGRFNDGASRSDASLHDQQGTSRADRHGPKHHSALSLMAKVIGPDESAALRDRLLAELKGIGCADEAALWAKRSLGEKNSLTDGDAQSIEDAFRLKVASFAMHEGPDMGKLPGEARNGVTQAGESLPAADNAGKDQATAQHLRAPTPKLAPIASTADETKEAIQHLHAPPSESKSKPKPRGPTKRRSLRPTDGGVLPTPTAWRQNCIDKSVLAFPEPRRIRDRQHVRYVIQQPCLVCGRTPCDAHHLRFTQSRALGRKVSDEFTVPLCRGHHREVHRCSDEAAWWSKQGVDPGPCARTLWLETHPLPFDQEQKQSLAERGHETKGGDQTIKSSECTIDETTPGAQAPIP